MHQSSSNIHLALPLHAPKMQPRLPHESFPSNRLSSDSLSSVPPKARQKRLNRLAFHPRLPNSRSHRYGAVIFILLATACNDKPARCRNLRISSAFARIPVPPHLGHFMLGTLADVHIGCQGKCERLSLKVMLATLHLPL